MKRKPLLSMAVTLCLMLPVSAQTDVTDQYLVNPSFEAPEDASTTGVGTVFGWERNYVDGYSWNGCNGDWKTEGERSYGIWSPVIDSDFEFWQELTVPNGIYTVTVDMTVSKGGGMSRVNGQRLFAGDTEAYYPASAETPADNGAAYPLSVTAKVTDGKLKIGIRTDGGTSVGIGWFKVDNFRLFAYEGDEGYLNYCRSQLENLSNEVNNLMQELPLGTATELSNLRDEIEQSVASSEVAEEYEEAIDLLAKAIAEMQPAHEVFLALLDKINVECEQLKAQGYPGLDAFNAEVDAAILVVNEPEATQADFEKAIEQLDGAIKAYRFSEFTEATADSPVDATWMIQSANFTKPGGDPSLSADRVSTGWVTANVSVNGDFRLNTVNGKNCWNNWSDNFTSMNVYQDLEGMPTGLYRFECYQTNNGPETTDQHAYITGLGGTSNSPYAIYTFVDEGVGGDFAVNSRWEGPLETGKVLVGTDGKLRIGFASTSNGNGSSGWFCFTDCVLRYYGPGSYSEAMENLIQEAEQLTVPESVLKTDLAVLDEAIKAARSVDVSDPAAADAGMLALNAAMTRTREALQAMASFKSGSYAKALAVAENPDYVYADDLVVLMKGVVATMNDWLYVSDTTTVAAYPGMTAELDRYLSFVTTYQACESYGGTLEDADLIQILIQVLAEQCRSVTEDIHAIESAEKAFKEIISFCDSYEMLVDYITEFGGDELGLLLGRQLEVVQSDHSAAPAAEKELLKALAENKFADVELTENLDMTGVIANSGFEAAEDESTTGVGTVSGWNRTTVEGYSWSGCNGDWKTEGERSFGIWKPAIESNFECWQTLVVPNGRYKVTVDMTVSKFNATSRVNGQRLFAGDQEVYYPAEAETATDNGDPYNLVVEVDVTGNKLDIGVRTDGGTANGIGWFKVDNFKLFWLGEPTAIHEIQTEAADELVAYVENGYIVVPGAESITVTTLNGVAVPAGIRLIPGIYLVKAGDRVTKVVVR